MRDKWSFLLFFSFFFFAIASFCFVFKSLRFIDQRDIFFSSSCPSHIQKKIIFDIFIVRSFTIHFRLLSTHSIDQWHYVFLKHESIRFVNRYLLRPLPIDRFALLRDFLIDLFRFVASCWSLPSFSDVHADENSFVDGRNNVNAECRWTSTGRSASSSSTTATTHFDDERQKFRPSHHPGRSSPIADSPQ